MREIRYMSLLLLKDELISFSNCECVLEVEDGLLEWMFVYMLDGEISKDNNEEMIERGIKEVSEYLNVNEDEEYVSEFVMKFREKIKDKEIVKVVIWSVEYDVSVSVFVC